MCTSQAEGGRRCPSSSHYVSTPAKRSRDRERKTRRRNTERVERYSAAAEQSLTAAREALNGSDRAAALSAAKTAKTNTRKAFEAQVAKRATPTQSGWFDQITSYELSEGHSVRDAAEQMMEAERLVVEASRPTDPEKDAAYHKRLMAEAKPQFNALVKERPELEDGVWGVEADYEQWLTQNRGATKADRETWLSVLEKRAEYEHYGQEAGYVAQYEKREELEQTFRDAKDGADADYTDEDVDAYMESAEVERELDEAFTNAEQYAVMDMIRDDGGRHPYEKAQEARVLNLAYAALEKRDNLRDAHPNAAQVSADRRNAHAVATNSEKSADDWLRITHDQRNRLNQRHAEDVVKAATTKLPKGMSSEDRKRLREFLNERAMHEFAQEVETVHKSASPPPQSANKAEHEEWFDQNRTALKERMESPEARERVMKGVRRDLDKAVSWWERTKTLRTVHDLDDDYDDYDDD